MHSVLFDWVVLGLVALVLEAITNTFYSLSVGIAAFATAIFAYLLHQPEITTLQAVVFLAVSIACAFGFPKVFAGGKKSAFATGLDSAIGKKFTLVKADREWKVNIDGVSYRIDENCLADDFFEGERVTVVSHDSGVVTVKRK